VAATPARRAICPSSALVEAGAGVRFSVRLGERPAPAFVVRHAGAVHAFLNICAHRGVELDWDAGRFFDIEGRWLICSTHGALHDPSSGACIAGPCHGSALTPLPVSEIDGEVCLILKDGLDLA
jgi:nitrite reductase/ring-hydroxylating ferredoxin subunit